MPNYLKKNFNGVFGELKKILEEEVVILGLGNPLRGDDGFGSLFAESLRGKIKFKVYNGGSSPENFLGKIVRDKPKTILIVDTADLGKEVGEIEIRSREEITSSFFFTHDLSPYILIDFLQETTGAKIYLLAIQPKSVRLGEKISREIEENLNKMVEWFIKNFSLEE